MIEIRYRYVFQDVDRHGTVRVYFWRRPGRKMRIREPLGSEAFAARYQELMAGGDAAASGPGTVTPGTLRWLVGQYVTSPHFRRLDPDTQRVRRQILEHCCREPVYPGAAVTYADFPISRVTTKALAVLRDRRIDKPEAANGRVKAMRGLFRWYAGDDRDDPARALKKIKTATGGFAPWSVADVEAFRARWPLGTRQRLALELLLLTGLRRSDIVELGRQHVAKGWIRKRLHKGRNSNPVVLEIPLLPELADVIAASPCGDLTYLVTGYGRPFTAAGFGGWFREACDAAGLKGRSAHGLRKAGATIAAERGATAHQLMALFGWSSLAQPERYTRSAARRRLAEAAMGLIVPTADMGEHKRGKKR